MAQAGDAVTNALDAQNKVIGAEGAICKYRAAA
jgi:hypothetical protein